MAEEWPEIRVGRQVTAARMIIINQQRIKGLGPTRVVPTGTVGVVKALARPGNNFGFEPWIQVRWESEGRPLSYYLRREDVDPL